MVRVKVEDMGARRHHRHCLCGGKSRFTRSGSWWWGNGGRCQGRHCRGRDDTSLRQQQCCSRHHARRWPCTRAFGSCTQVLGVGVQPWASDEVGLEPLTIVDGQCVVCHHRHSGRIQWPWVVGGTCGHRGWDSDGVGELTWVFPPLFLFVLLLPPLLPTSLLNSSLVLDYPRVVQNNQLAHDRGCARHQPGGGGTMEWLDFDGNRGAGWRPNWRRCVPFGCSWRRWGCG
jgi:hypothetical protein